MSFSKLSALGGLIAFASKVVAHGTVTGIVADGVYYEGYHATFQYLPTQPVVVGWSIPEDLSNGFIAPAAYNGSDIICHLGATNAMTSASVKAGGTVEMQWTAWPTSHKGPVIDYLAKCSNNDCTTVDKTTLSFFKIDGVGLLDDTTLPGNWASDTLIANNNSWTVTIPTDIAPGNYVLRHEIIALHSAESLNGAQNYPSCVNLEITGSGTATPEGTLGTDLYTETEPGILVNIYETLTTYIVPGPTIYSGAISMTQSAEPSATAAASVGSATGVVTSATAPSTTLALVATSSPAPSSSASAPPSAFSSLTAPYSNSTISTKKSKSACKAHSTSSSASTKLPTSIPSSIPVPAPVTTITTTAAVIPIPSTASTTALLVEATTSTPSIPTFTPSPTTPISTAPTSTSSPEPVTTPELPQGTTLNTLLSWLSAFYQKFSGQEYDADTVVARRHARDLVAGADLI